MNQKIIIFIGVDNSGKTTIAQKLSNEIGIPYYKKENEKSLFNNRDLNILFSEAFYMYSFLDKTGYSIIRDREYPCEFSLSKVYQRETREDLIWELDNKYFNLNTFFIFCYKDEYKNFSDELISFDKIEEIKNKYEEFLSLTKNKYLKLNTTDENLENQLLKIKEFIGE